MGGKQPLLEEKKDGRFDAELQKNTTFGEEKVLFRNDKASLSLKLQ